MPTTVGAQAPLTSAAGRPFIIGHDHVLARTEWASPVKPIIEIHVSSAAAQCGRAIAPDLEGASVAAVVSRETVARATVAAM